MGAPLRRGPGAGKPPAHLWHGRRAAGALCRAPAQGALGGLGHRLRGDSPAVAGAHPGGGHHRGGDAGEGRLAGPALGGGKRLFRHGGHCAGGRPAAWGAVPGGEPGRHRLQPALHRAGGGHPQRGWRPPRRPPGGQPLFGGCGPGGQVRPALWGQALPVLAAPAAGRGRGGVPQPPAGAQAAAAGAAAGGESALFVFAGVPSGRQARHGGGPGAPAGAGGRQPTQEIEAIYGDYRDNPEHRKQ